MATPHTARAQDPQTRPHRPSTWCLTQGEKGEADANNRQTRPQRSGPVRGEEGEACEYTCLHTTRALCPECLRVLDAEVRADADQVVWLWRRCPEHGVQQTRIWPDAAHYQKFCSLAFPPVPPASAAIRPTTQPCPTGCGICQRHRRRPTLVEIELTQRCNLHCPVCFMSAEADNTDLPLAQLDGFLAAIIAANGTDTALQLTGGEPTVRADLPEVVRRVRAAGFWGVEVNTNGLVISRDLAYLEGLVAAGLTGIYLQFDGLTSEVYTNIRGTDLLATKLQAVQNCRQAGIQVVLAMTVVAGLNDDQLGQVINYALDNSDTVVGVALQPAFTSGRFEAKSSAGLTMGDIIFALADQTHGLIGVDDILPLGCSHPLCDAGTYLVESADRATSADGGGGSAGDGQSAAAGGGGDGGQSAAVDACADGQSATADAGGGGRSFLPLTRGLSRADYLALFNPLSPQGSVFSDLLARQGVVPRRALSVLIMNYMDAYSADLERLQECSMFVTMADGSLVPFCAYQLTDCRGRRVFSPWLLPAADDGAVSWGGGMDA